MDIRNIPQVIADRAIACLPSHPIDRALLAVATIAAPITVALPSWQARTIAAPVAPIALVIADHRRDRRRLAGYRDRVAALELSQRDHIDEILLMTRNAEQARDQLEGELSSSLARAAALESSLVAARDKIATLEAEQAQWQQWEQGAIEDRHRLEIERAKLESDRQVVALELQGKIDRAHGDLSAAQGELDRAKGEIQFLAGNLRDCQSEIARLRSELDQYAGIEGEMERLRDRHETAIARRDLKILELTEARARAESAAAVERSLTDLGEVIAAHPRAMLLAGGEGSGKGTCAVAAINALAGEVGAIALILDVSEGDSPDSTWARAGIPATADPRTMIEFCRAVMDEMESGKRLHRSHPEFRNQPQIVIGFDELTTIFGDLKPAETEELMGHMTAFRTRGSKFGVRPIFMSQSEQIQNLKCGRHQILNSGNLSNFLRIWLGDVALDFVAKNQAMVSESVEQYIDANAGKYIALAVTTEGGARVLKPIRHPSHHGQIQGDGTPSRPIPSPKIIIPDWLPQGLQGAFCPVEDSDGPNPSPFGLEPSPALGRTPERPEGETGEFDPFGPLERTERSAIIAALGRSMGRAAIARSLYGASKGASPKYVAARAKIDQVAAELAPTI